MSYYRKYSEGVFSLQRRTSEQRGIMTRQVDVVATGQAVQGTNIIRYVSLSLQLPQ